MTTSNHPHRTYAHGSEEVLDVANGGVRLLELAAAGLIGLLLSPPLLVLAAVVAIPSLAIAALVAAVVAAIAVPTALVRRVRAHHREHGTTLFLHRLLRTTRGTT
jgi:hypothetical protein